MSKATSVSNVPVNCWPFAPVVEGDLTQILATIPKHRKRYATITRRHQLSREHNDARAKSVTVDGITFPSVAAASAHYGVPRPTAQARVNRGWSYEDAVSVPTKRQTLH